MKCLRKPAISVQYTLEKRHIPDMDDDPTGQTQVKGSNSDTVSVTGGLHHPLLRSGRGGYDPASGGVYDQGVVLCQEADVKQKGADRAGQLPFLLEWDHFLLSFPTTRPQQATSSKSLRGMGGYLGFREIR